MGSTPKSKEVLSLCSTLRAHQQREGARMSLVPILVDAPSAAAVFSISERAFHTLRRRSDFPGDATVVLGARCVRFRLEALHAFAQFLASTPKIETRQPPRRSDLRRGQERRAGGEASQAAASDRVAAGAPDGVRLAK